MISDESIAKVGRIVFKQIGFTNISTTTLCLLHVGIVSRAVCQVDVIHSLCFGNAFESHDILLAFVNDRAVCLPFFLMICQNIAFDSAVQLLGGECIIDRNISTAD